MWLYKICEVIAMIMNTLWSLANHSFNLVVMGSKTKREKKTGLVDPVLAVGLGEFCQVSLISPTRQR